MAVTFVRVSSPRRDQDCERLGGFVRLRQASQAWRAAVDLRSRWQKRVRHRRRRRPSQALPSTRVPRRGDCGCPAPM
eukprot:6175479-Pleurochrysis_carterae.AAC.2